MSSIAKTYSSTFLYGKYPEYEKKIFKFLMNGTEIEKTSEEFKDIAYEVQRRQIDNCLFKILNSDKVALMIHSEPLPKAFKVFCSRDLKSSSRNARRVYIDCSNIITKTKTGLYTCKNIDILISYLVSAMVNYIYYIDPARFTSNSEILNSGSKAFSLLMTHIIDYTCKISSMSNLRNKCIYICSLYYFTNILDLDLTKSTYMLARKNSSLSERDADIVNIQLKEGWDTNIKFLIETLSSVLRLNKLTLDVVVERWMYIYGTGTIFATELFPAFSSLLTDAYVGAFINNQKTIEKIVGIPMSDFTTAVLRIGGGAV